MKLPISPKSSSGSPVSLEDWQEVHALVDRMANKYGLRHVLGAISDAIFCRQDCLQNRPAAAGRIAHKWFREYDCHVRAHAALCRLLDGE